MNSGNYATYTYDRAWWESIFPLKGYQFVTGHTPFASIVTSPCHLAINDQLRAELTEELVGYIAIPTDLFVFGIGEPAERDITKIGGLPYRPAGLTWPLTPDGRTLTFLAQFRFVESRDILGPLPGDILLIFCKDASPTFNDEHAFVFEWHDTGLPPESLVVERDVPAPGWTFFNGFGIRHRTMDYPNTQQVFQDLEAGHLLMELRGTKIGGINPHIGREHVIPGQFLCSLGPLCCAFDTPYPWVNRAEPLSLNESDADHNSLAFGDAGSLLFHIDGNSMMHWEISSF